MVATLGKKPIDVPNFVRGLMPQAAIRYPDA